MTATIRLAEPRDLEAIVAQFIALWPEEDAADLRAHASAVLAGRADSTLPLVLFVAERAGTVVGFVEVGLRSHAEGCDARRAAGFVEGWYVVPQERRRGVGRALIVAAEDWARAQGCTEMGSDTWLDNDASVRAHERLGFEVVGRAVNLRKAL